MTAKALLIVAHGSRRKESNDEIVKLTQEIEKISIDYFMAVSCAFIQFTQPLFHSQVDALVEKGAAEILVFPYFIAAGSHVISDIPGLVEEARSRYPHLSLKLLPHLSKLPGVKNLILDAVGYKGKLIPPSK